MQAVRGVISSGTQTNVYVNSPESIITQYFVLFSFSILPINGL